MSTQDENERRPRRGALDPDAVVTHDPHAHLSPHPSDGVLGSPGVGKSHIDRPGSPHAPDSAPDAAHAPDPKEPRDLPEDVVDSLYRRHVADPDDPGQRAAARGALVRAVRGTARNMRRTAGRLDRVADRLSAVAVAQMETSETEREFAGADVRHRSRGPVQR